MEITEEELTGLIEKAFRAGKKTYRCDDDTMKLWVADEVTSFINKAKLEGKDENKSN